MTIVLFPFALGIIGLAVALVKARAMAKIRKKNGVEGPFAHGDNPFGEGPECHLAPRAVVKVSGFVWHSKIFCAHVARVVSRDIAWMGACPPHLDPAIRLFQYLKLFHREAPVLYKMVNLLLQYLAVIAIGN